MLSILFISCLALSAAELWSDSLYDPTQVSDLYQTRVFTNEDTDQYRVFKQISKYLLEHYPQYVNGRMVLGMSNMNSYVYADDVNIISPGCYAFPVNFFGKRYIEIEVTESEPVGTVYDFEVYRKLYLHGYERDLDLLLKLVSNSKSKEDDQNSIKVYQSTWRGEWNSGTVNGYTVIKKRNINTVFLDTNLVSKVLTDIHSFFEREDAYKEHGIPYHRNYLLMGPPGTGKTSFIHALASELNLSLSIINFHPYFDKESLVKCLRTIPKNTILVVEDVDALHSEDRMSQSDRNGLTFSDFINAIDGLTSATNGVLLFMTTNHPEKIDPAVLRPGRVDMRLVLDNASKSQVMQVFNSYHYDNDSFELFYQKIVDMGLENRLTTASLQNFFFRHLYEPVDNILEAASELSEYVSNVTNVADNAPTDVPDTSTNVTADVTDVPTNVTANV